MALRSMLGAPALLATCFLALISLGAAHLIFPGVPFQFTDASKHKVLTPMSAVVGTDTQVLGSNAAGVSGMYQVMGRAGPGEAWGKTVDATGATVFQLSSNFSKRSVLEGSVNPDFTSLLPRGSSGLIDMFIHFESPLPATVEHAVLMQDAATGALNVLSHSPVDWSAWGGLLQPCAGSITPWLSHLGSEEGDPDARIIQAATSFAALRSASSSLASRVITHARYWGLYLSDFESDAAFWAALSAVFTPYKYGYITEVKVANGVPSVQKWYSLGRAGWEMGLVMPDNKTVLLADDAGRNVGFFKFVADSAGNLTTGSLYAAKATQTSAVAGGMFTISWILLGRTNHTELATKVGSIRFSDIFDYAPPAAGTCPEGFRGTVSAGSGSECLKLKDGMQDMAAAFESRRLASYLSATTEFSKWEGMSYDAGRNVVYAALTAVDSGMLEGARVTGTDDVRLPENRCGCVYKLTLNAAYDVTAMDSLLCGDPSSGFIPGLGAVNSTCNIDGIANPDNLEYIPEQDTLLIAEDADFHENNMLWALYLPTMELTRLMAAPYGAEFTGTGFYDINGWQYIVNQIQHPYSGESAKQAEAMNTGTAGWIGYMGPFKRHGSTPQSAPALAFEHLTAPATNAQRHSVSASRRYVFGARNSISFMGLTRSNTTMGSSPAVTGAMVDAWGAPVYNFKARGNASIADNKSDRTEISINADFFSMHAVCDRRFSMLQHEALSPGPLEVMRVSQARDGTLRTLSGRTVDMSAWGGLWTPCAGSVTPFNTRFGGEEYEPNARTVELANTTQQFYQASDYLADIARYYGVYMSDIDSMKEAGKPYRYGFIYEAKPYYDGSVSFVKHYPLGRLAFELAYGMPDHRTVYMTDDGSNVGFWKFVADTENDYSAGNLYAAKFTQTSAVGGGAFDLEWIHLGYGRTETLMKLPETLKFSDIFDAAAPTGTACPATYTSMNTGSWGCECLRLKAGMEMAAAFFETRRYAAYLGATTEFSKWEGITFDPVRRQIFTSMSVVRQGMEDFKDRGANSSRFDGCGANHIRVQYNRCGCVYALDVDGDLSVTNMKELICGTPDSSVPGNNCHINGISEPDNVAMVAGHDQLIIGEDTGEHQNDVIWMFDLTTRSLTRILTTPYGSETTSPFWYANMGGYAYISATVQHPYLESDSARLNDAGSFGKDSMSGMIGPFTPLGPKADPDTQCQGSAVGVAVDFIFSGSVEPEWQERVAQFLQYKTERVLASYAPSVTRAHHVMSTLQLNSTAPRPPRGARGRGTPVPIKVRVMARVMAADASEARDIVEALTTQQFIPAQLQESARLMMGISTVRVTNIRAKRASQLAIVDSATPFRM